jgi:hypothetical protein
VALFFYRPIVALIGWPDTETPIYANGLGAALIGLSLAVWFAANHPEQSRDTILASIALCVALAGRGRGAGALRARRSGLPPL